MSSRLSKRQYLTRSLALVAGVFVATLVVLQPSTANRTVAATASVHQPDAAAASTRTARADTGSAEATSAATLPTPAADQTAANEEKSRSSGQSAATRSLLEASKRARSSSYSTAVYGAWVQPACVPTSAAPSADKPTHIVLVCTLTYTGSWTAQVIEYIEGDVSSDFVATGTNEYYIYGRDGRDNTCGSLHVLENVTVDALTSATHAVGTILGGTGDWVGSTGTVLVDGSIFGGPGIGGYSGTWTRPGTPKPVTSIPCVPPQPTDLPPPPVPAPSSPAKP